MMRKLNMKSTLNSEILWMEIHLRILQRHLEPTNMAEDDKENITTNISKIM